MSAGYECCLRLYAGCMRYAQGGGLTAEGRLRHRLPGWSRGDRVGQAACDGPDLRTGEQAALGKVTEGWQT